MLVNDGIRVLEEMPPEALMSFTRRDSVYCQETHLAEICVLLRVKNFACERQRFGDASFERCVALEAESGH